MRKQLLLLLFLSVFLTGCRDRLVKLPELAYSPMRSFSEFPDSSFFKSISCMDVVDGKLYMFDQTRSDVAVLDLQTDSFYTVGAHGQGPEELANPYSFYVQADTVYIWDGGALTLKGFAGGRYSHTLAVCGGSMNRFFVEGDTIYLPLVSDEASFVKVPKLWQRGDEAHLVYGRHVFQISEDPSMNSVRNVRHLLKGTGCFYAVCPSYPVVEKYDLHTDALLASYDLSRIDFVKDDLDFIAERNSGPKSYTTSFKDAYCFGNKLFILFSSQCGGFSTDKVIVLEDKGGELVPTGLIQLTPGAIFESVCVDENCFYAMNYETSSVEIYQFGDPL